MTDVVRTMTEVRSAIAQWRNNGESVGLVPTMGALHDGHLSLVRQAQTLTDRVVVSIFVNPTQFAPHEDFTTYPRTEDADLCYLRDVGADLAWLPEATTLYPPQASTTVSVAGLSEGLCAVTRPHFFTGVATVVAKLLIAVTPDVAIFGEKDYQQLQVIKRLHADLLLAGRIVGGSIVREADGLAMSSRNAYLNDWARQIAPALYREMAIAAGRLGGGEPVSLVLDDARACIVEAGFDAIDYLELRDASSLEPLITLGTTPARLLAAVHLSGVRLIDNVPV